ARLGDIENVVDDLKRETERAPELCYGGELLCSCVRAHRAETNRRGQNRGRLILMNVAKIGQAYLFAFSFQVSDLAGDQFAASGCDRDLPEQREGFVAMRRSCV